MSKIIALLKKYPLVAVLAVLVGAYVVWYLASPLFINNVVDEAFPFEMPAQMDNMTDAEKAELEQEFMEAMPSDEEIAALSDDDRMALEKEVQAAAAVVMSDKMMEDEMPEAATEWVTVGQGTFVGADSFHLGSGDAIILQQGDQSVLRFENFDVTNGPDLHVILSSNPNPTSSSDIGDDYIDLGSLKGNQGNQNYEIPADVDLSQYSSVVIYCMPFHVVFSTATLN